MAYWLMKTEPETFSFDDLVKAPNRTTFWEGVRNYQARNLMRDDFKLGDLVFIYHSNTDDPSVMGVAEVVKTGYPDDSALDPKSEYFDERAKAKGQSPWVMVDVRAVQRMKIPVTRTLLREETSLKDMMVLKNGSRLSVQPVTPAEFKKVVSLGKPEKL